jgi:glutathione S-transferase
MADRTEPALSSRTPTLHHLSSSASFRVLWALEELAANGQQYNLKRYLRQQARAPEELKTIFPLGKAPILVVEPHASSPDEKPVVVAETRLILQYIADNYSDGIWNPSAEDTIRNSYFEEFAGMTLLAKVESVLYFDVIPPFLPFIVRPFLGPFCNYVASLNKKELDGPFQLMENALSEEEPWFTGQKIGLADFLLSFPMDISEQRKYFDGKKYPKLAGWLQRVHERAAYKRALEKGGSYDLATFDTKK